MCTFCSGVSTRSGSRILARGFVPPSPPLPSPLLPSSSSPPPLPLPTPPLPLPPLPSTRQQLGSLGSAVSFPSEAPAAKDFGAFLMKKGSIWCNLNIPDLPKEIWEFRGNLVIFATDHNSSVVFITSATYLSSPSSWRRHRHDNTIQYNTIQLSLIPRPVYDRTRERNPWVALLQQSTFMPQHSVDVVSYFHSIWGSAALLNAHPKNSQAQAEPWFPAQPGTQCTTLLRGMKAR